MKINRLAPLLFECIAATFILVFLYTAVSKLLDLRTFREGMRHVTWLRPYAAFLAVAIPLIEIVISIGLLIPRSRYAGVIASTIMMCIFTGYIGYLLVSGDPLPCNCGGIISTIGWTQHLVLNIALTFLGVLGITMNYIRSYHDSRRSRIPV